MPFQFVHVVEGREDDHGEDEDGDDYDSGLLWGNDIFYLEGYGDTETSF